MREHSRQLKGLRANENYARIQWKGKDMSEQTGPPQGNAPGPAQSSLDPELQKKVEAGTAVPDQNSQEYLDAKSRLTPQGIIDALRNKNKDVELDNPTIAILVTELHELKAMLRGVQLSTFLLTLGLAATVYLIAKEGTGKPA